MKTIRKFTNLRLQKGRLLVSMLAVVLIALAVSLLGVALAAGTTFTENWAGASSPFFSFLQQGGGTIASNVADSGAGDGRVVQLNLAAFPAAGPNAAPNLLSTDVYGFGTYEARMKTADCSSQPNTGIISGFFTYLNDGTDQNGNGIKDNSEIDFEWLCAEPNVIWLTMWTDYQEAPTLAMRRVYRELDLRTGQIRRTCYSTNFGQCDVNLTGSATEGSPSSIAGIANYNSATAYYTYGFTWLSNRMTWYIIHPTSGAKVILWDYQGPTSRITQRQARYMFNVWHTNNWPPPSMPAAIQQPNTSRNIKIDWVKYTVPGGGGTATSTPPPGGGSISPTAWYSVHNRGNGKCVDARGAATANGTAIQQFTCNSSFAQQYQFQPTSGGYYRVNNRNNSAQVWDVSGVSTADNALIHLWSYVGGNNQQWLPVSEGGGFWRFVARHSGKCLDVPAASTADGVQLVQYTCNGSGAQSFSLQAH